MVAIKLRAFEITNTDINKMHSDVKDKLKSFLKNSKTVNERRMLLNTEDPQKEEDFISNFSKDNLLMDVIFCTMLRVAFGNNVQHINTHLFEKPNFTIEELNNSTLDTDSIYKNHYYFALNNNYLVTNLQGNITITRLQTYLNWLLNDLYEISPLLAEEIVPSISDIKDIVVKDTSIYPTKESENSTQRSSFDLGKIALNLIKNALIDSDKLSDIELEQMISARLVIEFKKPKKSDSESLKKAYSALLKPVSDLDNFEFVTRDNKKIIKGKQILRIKEVSIETTDSGLLNEAQLSQEMIRFIRDLENEKQHKASD